ncbi:bacterio-opsin activator domain-containing protein, partial [Halorussus litoreus]|uniref:bacterio-opsin activator domain-containing protein n=1 Tax=Halorussus litoreus TaxID=1710536 RepID=UPI000E21E49E
AALASTTLAASSEEGVAERTGRSPRPLSNEIVTDGGDVNEDDADGGDPDCSDADGGDSERELQDRIRQQHAVAEFSRQALADRPLDELFDEAVELVANALDHDYAKVLELRPDEDDLLLRAGVGWREGVVGSATVGTNRESQAGYTLLSSEPVVVEDLTTEDRFSGPELLTSHDVSGGISTVVGSCDEPWGILGTHDTDRRSYANHDVEFVRSMAHLLATAIERHERERELQRHDAMLDAVSDGVYALDADSRYVAVNDAYLELTGYSREEILGSHVTEILGEGLFEQTEWVQEALEAGEDVVTVEGEMPTRDGESVPVEARVTPFRLSNDDELARVGVVRDVSDRKLREAKLTELTGTAGSLADAETPDAICEATVDAAVDVLGFPNAAVALYDDAASALVPEALRWDGDTIDDALLGARSEGAAWRTFVDSESRVVDDLGVEAGEKTDAEAAVQADEGVQAGPSATALSSALTIPLGKHGVFVAASPEPGAFDGTDRSLADLLCSNVRSALDRASREVTLREQRDELRTKNRELERVNRVNGVIRELTKAVTQASSPEEVGQATCDRLTESGLYRFAWFGTLDRATDEVEPATWAGVEEGYLDEVIVTADGESARGQGPAGRAVRTKEVQVQDDLLGDPPFEPWREQALKRGYRSSASVPVVYDGTVRGVLNLYAGESGAFDETERAVLTELGEFVGYAMNALEQRRALASDRSVELDFRVRGTSTAVLAFVSDADAEFEFESAVQRADGRLHVFFTISGPPAEETLDYVEDVPWIEDVRLVADRDDEHLYETTLSENSFLTALLDRSAMPRTLTAADGEGRFVIRVPWDADVRTFVDLFEDYYEDVELVARRERDEPVLTRQEFESELADRLTDRQREVVRMAYFGGFFEWPRESTAEEIADALGVSQPTVSRHVRRAERELFALLFEEP